MRSHHERGATKVEYIILIGCAAVACIGSFVQFGGVVKEKTFCLGESFLNMAPKHCGDGKGASQSAIASNSGSGGGAASAFDSSGVVCTNSGGCGVPGKNCFAAGTMVRTKNGMRAIETFSAGESVMAASDETFAESGFEIEKVVVTENAEIMELTVSDDEHHDETFKVTPRHAFWVEGGQDWVKAEELKIGDAIRTEKGSPVHVVSSEKKGEKTKVYNLEVKDVHTYYVGALGLFSHNSCERVPVTKHLRELATTGELWQKSRFDAINKLAACRDLTAKDYDILAEAAKHEGEAKQAYLQAMQSSPMYTSEEGRKSVKDALERRWFDRAEQALLAAASEGDTHAASMYESLSAPKDNRLLGEPTFFDLANR